MTSAAFPAIRFSTMWHERHVMPHVCRARSCTRRGNRPSCPASLSWRSHRRPRCRPLPARTIDAHSDDTSPQAVAVDQVVPPSAATLHRALVDRWPRLAGRIELLEGLLDSVVIQPTDIVVSIHACGTLTDLVLERAIAARARVAVLPVVTTSIGLIRAGSRGG